MSIQKTYALIPTNSCHKCQLKNNQNDGYCLFYHNNKIISAKKYKEGKQINEWTDYKSFKKENNLRDLK